MNDATPNADAGRSATERVATAFGVTPFAGWMITVSTVGIFLILLSGVLYVGRALFVPIAAALLANFAVQPMLRRIVDGTRMPAAVMAPLLVLGLTMLAGSAVYGLTGPASRWATQTPAKLERIEHKLRAIRAPVEKISRAAEQIEDLTDTVPEPAPKPEVVLQTPSLVGRMLEGTGRALFGLGVFVVFLYFLLVSGDAFLRKIVRMASRLEEKKTAVSIFRGIEGAISRYLLTIGCINAALACVVAVAMWAIGMPEAIQIGLLAGLLNFAPYVGPVTGVGITAVLALVHYDSPVQAMIAPALFAILTTLEGYFLTPWLLGRGLLLSPVMVLGGVLLWGALWGAPGAILAVPILVSAKVVCDHLEPLAPIGDLLGR